MATQPSPGLLIHGLVHHCHRRPLGPLEYFPDTDTQEVWEELNIGVLRLMECRDSALSQHRSTLV